MRRGSAKGSWLLVSHFCFRDRTGLRWMVRLDSRQPDSHASPTDRRTVHLDDPAMFLNDPGSGRPLDAGFAGACLVAISLPLTLGGDRDLHIGGAGRGRRRRGQRRDVSGSNHPRGHEQPSSLTGLLQRTPALSDQTQECLLELPEVRENLWQRPVQLRFDLDGINP